MTALLALAVAFSPPPAVVADFKFRLEGMEMMDQEARNQLVFAINNGQQERSRGIGQELTVIDHENTEAVKRHVLAWGWPTISDFGARHAGIAWLLVQHADQDVAFQKKCLRLMEPLVPIKEVSGPNYAYLYDRVARNTGRPQRYGTQLSFREGKMSLQETEDVKNLDKRRRSVGLGPVREYIRVAEEFYNRKS